MAITVKFNGIAATIDGGKWPTDKDTDYDGLFKKVLNGLLEADLETGDYGTAGEPDIDHSSAIAMAQRFAGKITDMSKHEPSEHGEEGRDHGNGIKVLY